MKISTIRKKIKNPNWLVKKYFEYIRKMKDWESFYDFECSDFFQGKDIAEHNRSVYYQKHARVRRHLDVIKNNINLLNIDITKYGSIL